jgi:hypothetical protein
MNGPGVSPGRKETKEFSGGKKMAQALRKVLDAAIEIVKLEYGKLSFCILGKTPMFYNAMSAKAKRDLLFPPKKKNRAQKEGSLKHDPIKEFRDSVYRTKDDLALARLMIPATAFKAAISSVAKDVPGATKAEIGRLTWVVGDTVPIFGVPSLHMSVVRSADMNRTPDVRTRAILPKWAAAVTVEYLMPNLNQKAIANLMGNAGRSRGIGDWRVEKGSGNFGQFEIVTPDNPEFKSLLKEAGRAAQDEALKNWKAYDAETEELLAWFFSEAESRDIPFTK